MLSSTTAVVQATNASEHINPRRIRHITEIQIRNLTPFPVRDAVTNALTQPTEQSQFSVSGPADDLGAIVSRKHTRKLSTNSTGTRLNLKWEDGILEEPERKPPPESRARRTSTSSTIHSNHLNTSTSSSKSLQQSGISRPARSLRGHRPRTSSMTSSSSNHWSNSLFSAGESSTAPSAFVDHSQASLEKIIHSRMVETFIAISIPPSNTTISEPIPSNLDVSVSLLPLRSAPISKPSSPFHSRGQKSFSLASANTKHSAPSMSSQKTRVPMPGSAPPSKTTFQPMTSPQQDSKAKSNLIGRPNGFGSSSSSVRAGKQTADRLPEKQEVKLNGLETPVYFSPIQRPSTNPLFSLDSQAGHDFPPYCDTSGQFLKIEVWGKVSTHERNNESSVQRYKESGNEEGAYHWKLLDEKEVHLDKLLPLPNDLETNPSQLPSNTILITLSPPGQTFYLPHLSSSLVFRSHSPAGGYTSDPESEIRKAKQISDQPISDAETAPPVEILPLSRRRRYPGPHGSSDFKGGTKTASWQDLFKLVNLQSLIADNEASLGEVIRKINGLLEDDKTYSMRREISERESRIKDVAANHKLAMDQIAQRRMEIADRTQKLEKRSQMLASARNTITFNPEMNYQIEDERHQLVLIHSRISATRTSLLSTLSTIFPIELYSPPDLLYTILDVPLPIPLNATDPAPPLSMPEHKDVTEDAVATALGYVAQVLQILAAYIGKNLIYPVTCIGSRSLIRDGISAMVGPRMFPLFSKGVDAYRFEYGVFLLNKDIEMLMSERDLRALDMRHTLPNLKNLLLTLSHDNNLQIQLVQTAFTPTGLGTPLRTPSPTSNDVQTPKPSHADLDTRSITERATTPTPSGSTTPTAATVSDESKKQRSFLGFVPFTDFLRSRYPSTSTTKSGPSSETGEDDDSKDEGSSDDSSEENEEDRMTIHATASDSIPEAAPRDVGTVADV